MSRHIILLDDLLDFLREAQVEHWTRPQIGAPVREAWQAHGIDPEKDPEGAAKRIEAAARKRRYRRLKRMGISHALAKAFTS